MKMTNDIFQIFLFLQDLAVPFRAFLDLPLNGDIPIESCILHLLQQITEVYLPLANLDFLARSKGSQSPRLPNSMTMVLMPHLSRATCISS